MWNQNYKVCFAILLSLVLCPTLRSLGQDQTPAQPAVAPEAVKALEQMGAYLRALKGFEVQATATREEVLENGQKVHIDGSLRIQVRRPDRLHAEILSDRKHREFFYDGKTFTLWAPRQKYYAVVPAPPTLGELVQTLGKRYGIETPLADLFLWGTEHNGQKDFQSALVLGPSKVEGTECIQYAFREEGIDWQVWVEKGDKPLPRKLVVTTTSIPAQPEHIAVLKWNLAPESDDRQFTFAPPEGAMKIVLQTADGQPATQETP